MDFKDKVTEISKKAGKVATDTYNTVADKSGKLFEEAKARISISEMEKDIEKYMSLWDLQFSKITKW